MFESFKRVRVTLFRSHHKVKVSPLRGERAVRGEMGFRLELDEDVPDEVVESVETHFPGLRQRLEDSVDGRRWDDQLEDTFPPLTIRLHATLDTHHAVITLNEAIITGKVKCLVQGGSACLEFKVDAALDEATWNALYHRLNSSLWIDIDVLTEDEAPFDAAFAAMGN